MDHREQTESEIKLNALLEVTKAINSNQSVSQLLELYQDILQNRLGVGRLALFSFDKSWECILTYGVPEFPGIPKFEEELLCIDGIETITYSRGLLSKYFEIVVPVYHKTNPLAFVLLGDVDPHKVGLSNSVKHLPYAQTLTNFIVVAIENKKLFRANIQKAQINKELELAQNMQQMLFPSSLPDSDSFAVGALYLPHQQVGGDYYDFIQLNNHEYIFCIADVSGKGVSAAILMSNLQATLQSLCNYTHNLKDIIIELNKRVIKNTRHEKFVSFFLAKINTKSQQLTYINAGHNSPLLYIDNKFKTLTKGTTLLGIQEELKEIEVDIIDYASDFILFCYTDGLTDAINAEKENVSINDITNCILTHKNNSPLEINDAIITIANEHRGDREFTDDIALLTLKVTDLIF